MLEWKQQIKEKDTITFIQKNTYLCLEKNISYKHKN